jgi:hypothetical protein
MGGSGQRVALIPIAILFAFVASSASAQSIPAGSGHVEGNYKLRISDCGKDRGTSYEVASLDNQGQWSEDVGTRIGTVNPGSNARLLTITYDAQSVQIVQGAFVNLAQSLCNSPFTMTSFQFSGTAKLNKRMTRVKVRKTVQFSGSAAGGSHTGSGTQNESGSWLSMP